MAAREPEGGEKPPQIKKRWRFSCFGMNVIAPFFWLAKCPPRKQKGWLFSDYFMHVSLTTIYSRHCTGLFDDSTGSADGIDIAFGGKVQR